MLETAGALEHVEAIAALDGVDALFVGPADLSLALGFDTAPAWGEPALDDALARVVAACQANGIAAGSSAATARRRGSTRRSGSG